MHNQFSINYHAHTILYLKKKQLKLLQVRIDTRKVNSIAKHKKEQDPEIKQHKPILPRKAELRKFTTREI